MYYMDFKLSLQNLWHTSRADKQKYVAYLATHLSFNAPYTT
jgi:hypothetical protein